MAAQTDKLHIDVWADVACPYCYVGKQRLETAISRSGHQEEIELELHTFELDASAPKEPAEIASYTAQKMGVSLERALEMDRRVKGMADQDGLPYETERIHANSFDALRLLQLAKQHGVANELMSRLQRALFSGRRDTYDHAAMTASAVEVGIPEDEVRTVLAGDQFTAQVRRDQQAALRLGATGVPFVVLAGRYGVPGSGTVQSYADAIRTAWENR